MSVASQSDDRIEVSKLSIVVQSPVLVACMGRADDYRFVQLENDRLLLISFCVLELHQKFVLGS